MTQKNVIERLKRVVEFYDKQLDLLKAQLLAQNKAVKKCETERLELEQRLAQSHASLQNASSTLSARLMGSRFDAYTQTEISAKQVELDVANSELQAIKAKVLEQMLKLKSMEKLIDRKETILSEEFNKQIQISADEQYLSSKTSGLNL